MTLAADRASHSDTVISYPESVWTTLATACFLSRCRDATSCVATCGVFAGPLHAEVAGWTAGTIPFPAAADIPCPPARRVEVLALLDQNL
jgi:hypothetical protein